MGKNDQQELLSILPEWVDKEIWQAWLDIRGKSANKLSALKLILRKLDSWRQQGHNPNDILEHSVICGYRGVFLPTKPTGNKPPTKNGKGAIIV